MSDGSPDSLPGLSLSNLPVQYSGEPGDQSRALPPREPREHSEEHNPGPSALPPHFALSESLLFTQAQEASTSHHDQVDPSILFSPSTLFNTAPSHQFDAAPPQLMSTSPGYSPNPQPASLSHTWSGTTTHNPHHSSVSIFGGALGLELSPFQAADPGESTSGSPADLNQSFGSTHATPDLSLPGTDDIPDIRIDVDPNSPPRPVFAAFGTSVYSPNCLPVELTSHHSDPPIPSSSSLVQEHVAVRVRPDDSALPTRYFNLGTILNRIRRRRNEDTEHDARAASPIRPSRLRQIFGSSSRPVGRPTADTNEDSTPSGPPAADDWDAFGRFMRPLNIDFATSALDLSFRGEQTSLTTASLPSHRPVLRRPALWPSPTPTQPIVNQGTLSYALNPLLRHRVYGPSPLEWDIRYPPSIVYFRRSDQTRSEHLPPSGFAQPATWPLCSELHITVCADDPHEHWPWPMIAQNSNGVLLEDVLRAIHTNFTQALWQHEWEAIPPNRQIAIGRAWSARMHRQKHDARIAALVGHRPRDDVGGVLRLDYLLEHTFFRGLEPLSSGRGWIIYFGAE